MNRDKAIIKQEPAEVENKRPRVQRQHAGHSQDAIPMDFKPHFGTIPSNTYYLPQGTRCISNDPASLSLPATLDMFHEEDERDDGGYCSASDASSVNSQGQCTVKPVHKVI